MTFLWRFLVVLSLTLLSMQGAFAHEHGVRAMMDDGPMQMAGAGVDTHAHCTDMAAPGMPCPCDHACCCTSACGAHCAALPVAFRFEPRVSDISMPKPLSEPRHAGVTHAPLFRPPIG